ncbi:MAG: type II secretion system F family protein [Streptosporangiaceae bacterium]
MTLSASPLLPVAVLCGLGTGLGLWLAVTALMRPDADTSGGGGLAVTAWWSRHRGQQPPAVLARRAGLALAAAVAAGLATGWPAGTVLAALAVWSAPSVLGRDKEAAGAVARIEAIAGWTEMLRDTVSAAAGLEQASGATAPLAPETIRPQVAQLAGRMAGGARLDGALRDFAAEVADPLADLVVAALIHAAAHHARRLGELLGSLAASARAQASMRLRVEAGRASLRTSVRMITTVTAVMAAGLVLLNRGYLAPYDSVGGQLVLLLVGVIFTTGFTLLRRMARHQQPARILAAGPRPSAPSMPPGTRSQAGTAAAPLPGTGE